MQALIEKIEAADAAHFAALRAKGKAQSDALAKAREKTLEKKRENLRVCRTPRLRTRASHVRRTTSSRR
jgi:hypothetical protein